MDMPPLAGELPAAGAGLARTALRSAAAGALLDASEVASSGPGIPGGGGMHLPQNVTVADAVACALGVVVFISALCLLCGYRVSRRRTPVGRILQLAVGESHILVPATFCLFIGSGLSLMLPFFGGQFINLLTSKDGLSTEAVDTLMLQVLGVAVVQAAFTGARGYMYQLAGERVINKLRKRVFRSLLRQEVAYFDRLTSGVLISRLTNDTSTLQSAATSDISIVLRSFATLVLSMMILFLTSWKLTLAMLVVVPAVSILAGVMGRLSRLNGKKYQDSIAEAGKVAGEALANMRTVRAYSQGESLMTRNFVAASDETYKCGKFNAVISASWSGVVGMFFYIAFITVLWFGARLVQAGELKTSELVSFVLYTLSLSASIMMLGSVMPRFGTVIGATIKIFEIIEREPTMLDGTLDPGEHCTGLVEFDKVSFTYETRADAQVLKSVSFVARPGQVVALVGPSGSGKSSCVSLLQRLYDCTEGCVRLDGHDLRELSSAYLRRHISIVAQEPVLFACSVRENIRFGIEHAGAQEAMIEVAKLANCHEFVEEFAERYETLVGERGIQLSGGQKQRVAIARALMVKPKILLLDEATSALDAESERVVQEALNNLMAERRGTTNVVVAHRLSTVRGADLIVVLKGGEVVEHGTHDDLLLADGVYKDLVRRQLQAPEQVAGTQAGED